MSIQSNKLLIFSSNKIGFTCVRPSQFQYVCISVCVCERERERERDCVRVGVLVWVCFEVMRKMLNKAT